MDLDQRVGRYRLLSDGGMIDLLWARRQSSPNHLSTSLTFIKVLDTQTHTYMYLYTYIFRSISTANLRSAWGEIRFFFYAPFSFNSCRLKWSSATRTRKGRVSSRGMIHTWRCVHVVRHVQIATRITYYIHHYPRRENSRSVRVLRFKLFCTWVSCLI